MNQTGKPGWPTACRLCRRAQYRAICADCLAQAGLAAPRCARCGLRLDGTARALDTGLCLGCEQQPPVFDHALAALDYEAPWSGLISGLKFQQDPALAGTLAALMARQVRQRWQAHRPGRATEALAWRRGAPTVLLPVPLSPQRLRERGYNQAWLLARQLGVMLRLPVLPDGVVRHKNTLRLMTLDADERARHIRGAFRVAPRWLPRLQGRHVAVIDDVLTTGATLDEVARTLWSAGVREVSVWVAARTPAPGNAPAPAGPGHSGLEWPA